MLQLVHELKLKDIEEHRKRIEDRDKNHETSKTDDSATTGPPPEVVVFTFDQEDIQASKMMTFDKVIKFFW